MVSIATTFMAFFTCLITLDLAAWEVFITKTGNHRRCRKLCTYQEACNCFYFRNKQCLLITDSMSEPYGEIVDKSRAVSGVCNRDEVCVPTGIVGPGYRREMVLGVDMIGLKGFRIHTRGIDFDRAVQYCEEQGGQLFVVENHTEWQTIALLAIEDDILVGTGLKGLWINGNDRNIENNYVTTSGDPIPYFNRGMYQPNDISVLEDKDCINLKKNYNFQMDDASCLKINRGFICEWNLF